MSSLRKKFRLMVIIGPKTMVLLSFLRSRHEVWWLEFYWRSIMDWKGIGGTVKIAGSPYPVLGPRTGLRWRTGICRMEERTERKKRGRFTERGERLGGREETRYKCPINDDVQESLWIIVMTLLRHPYISSFPYNIFTSPLIGSVSLTPYAEIGLSSSFRTIGLNV